MIDTAVAFPEIRQDDPPVRRAEVGSEIGAWCQGRVPGHVTANGVLPVSLPGPLPEADMDRLLVWLDDDRGLPGGETSTAFFNLSYKELCQSSDPAELVAAQLKGMLAELALFQYRETKERLEAQAPGDR